MPDKGQQFKQRLQQLQEVIMSGLACYAVWNTLRFHDPKEVSWSLDRQNQVLSHWRGFFTPVAFALQSVAVLEFAKVFDTDPRTASLAVLLKQAEEDTGLIPYADKDALKEIADRLRKAESTLGTIKTLRNQKLAHSDASPDSLPPLMNEQLDSLADDIKYAFDGLSSAHDRNVTLWDFPLETTSNHTIGILELLSKEIGGRQQHLNETLVRIVVDHIRGMESTLGRSLDEEELGSTLREFALTPEQAERVRRDCGPGLVESPSHAPSPVC